MPKEQDKFFKGLPFGKEKGFCRIEDGRKIPSESVVDLDPTCKICKIGGFVEHPPKY